MATQSSGDTVAMAQAAQRVDASAEILKGLKDKIYGTVTSVTASSWQGPAARAFLNVGNVYIEDLGKVLTALEDIHMKLVGSKIQFESSQQDQVLAVQKIDALLNGTT